MSRLLRKHVVGEDPLLRLGVGLCLQRYQGLRLQESQTRVKGQDRRVRVIEVIDMSHFLNVKYAAHRRQRHHVSLRPFDVITFCVICSLHSLVMFYCIWIGVTVIPMHLYNDKQPRRVVLHTWLSDSQSAARSLSLVKVNGRFFNLLGRTRSGKITQKYLQN